MFEVVIRPGVVYTSYQLNQIQLFVLSNGELDVPYIVTQRGCYIATVTPLRRGIRVSYEGE